MRFIGDGDSSVHPTLLNHVTGWGRDIKKMECANHSTKCYRSSLENLVVDNPAYKGKGGLTVKMRKRLTSAARCAIKMRSGVSDRAKAVKLLERDLINGPYHCFGHHSKCSPDFCKTAQHKLATSSSNLVVSPSNPATSQPDTVTLQSTSATSSTSPSSSTTISSASLQLLDHLPVQHPSLQLLNHLPVQHHHLALY
jgi:hypothetical protein